MQETEDAWHQLAGHEPGDDSEPQDFSDGQGHGHHFKAALLSGRIALANGEADYEQGDELDDDDGGEDLDADGLAQTPLVDEGFRDDAEAGEREHAGQAKGLSKAEIELEVENVVRCDGEGDKHRKNHGDYGGEEDSAADCGDEARDIEFLQANEEEEHENADAKDELYLGAGVDEAGDRSKDETRYGVGEDGVQAKSLAYAFKELGGDDERPNGKEGFLDFHAVVSSPASSLNSLVSGW